ncbi:MAG: ROK family protein [Spirochaetes bacterium]|nr:ROK family protein [Spirochaetota bacterium]
MNVLGIDIGGSGVKAAPVNTKTGKILQPVLKISVQKSAEPQEMMKAVKKILLHFKWTGPIGCGFPGSLRNGKVLFLGNLNQNWVGKSITSMLKKHGKSAITVVNDADAAGLAEMNFGAGKDKKGVVFLITAGTGIGTAVFIDGKLLPNTEFGHIELRGKIAEKRASAAVRTEQNLTYKEWAFRLDEYFSKINKLLWPDLIIIGGGISENFKEYKKHFTVPCRIVPAKLKNNAGIIGAAMSVIASKQKK